MKKYIVISVVALSIIVIIIGRYQYDQKLSTISSTAQEMLSEQAENVVDEEEVGSSENNTEDVVTSNNAESDEETSEFDVEALLENVPQPIAEKIEEKLTNEEQVTILAFGSKALTDSQDEGIVPWPELFMDNINEAYDTDLFQVETMAVGDMTSLEMVQQGVDQEVADKNADIFLIEPLLWNDNGEVRIDHSTDHLLTLWNTIMTENEEAVAIIQSSQPAYDTVNYPIQMEGLRNFVNENDLLYIDHWSDWPDIRDIELVDYVDEDHRMPTQRGHEQWSDSVMSIFVSND
ncbi:hypothetical protein [Salipaludibacillus daqingensis]|uniref:hypothetical protein n=1 Tax=Salipaludibacillus daqingensis TaxID=3041001 RepID=UPI0024743CDE|nr:hypothetical protein [Salipaludibacillus daqingensis]